MKKQTLIMIGMLSMAGYLSAEDAVTAPPAAAAEPVATTAPKKVAKKKKKIVKASSSSTKTDQPISAPPASPAAAGEPAKDKTMSKSLEAWLVKLRKRVAGSKAKQNKLVAVAAVRGAEASNEPAPLYWKGKETEKVVNKSELDEFNLAIESAMSGDQANAKAKLEQFIASNPKSPLVDDASQTLEMIKQDEAAPADTATQ